MESCRRGPSPLSQRSTPLSPPPQLEPGSGRARLLPPPPPQPSLPERVGPPHPRPSLSPAAALRAGGGAARAAEEAGGARGAAISAPPSRCPFMEMKDRA